MTQDFERDMRASMGEVRERVARIDERTKRGEDERRKADAKLEELDDRVGVLEVADASARKARRWFAAVLTFVIAAWETLREHLAGLWK